jgi:ribonuclease HI
MIQSIKHDEFTCMVVTMWALWHARRKAIHEDCFQSPMAMHMFVQSFLQDLLSSEEKKPTRVGAAAMRCALGWLPPQAGECKMNVDAAVAKTANKGVVGAVCRSYDGGYLGASVIVFEGITNPAFLEALACREALALAADLNLGDITVASDCLEVVKGLHDQYLGLSSHILVEIKDTARARGGVCFRHEGRKMNTEAHNLARFASSLPQGRHVWLNHVPEGLNFPVNIFESL